jgi:hypothetical protein
MGVDDWINQSFYFSMETRVLLIQKRQVKKKGRQTSPTTPTITVLHGTSCLPIVFTFSSLSLSLPQLACRPRLLILMLVSSAASTRVWRTAPAPLCTFSCSLKSLYVPDHSHFHSTDISCVCGSQSFQATAGACLKANCSASDQAAAVQLRNQECGSMCLLPFFFPTCSVDLLSLPASSSTAASSTGTGTGTSASPKSSTGAATSILIEQLPFLTTVIAIAGVALGGAFAL